MTLQIQQILRRLFQADSLDEVSRQRLEELVEQHPSFGVGRYLLSKKLQLEKAEFFLQETGKANLYFTNPYWLQWLLDGEAPVTKEVLPADLPREALPQETEKAVDRVAGVEAVPEARSKVEQPEPEAMPEVVPVAEAVPEERIEEAAEEKNEAVSEEKVAEVPEEKSEEVLEEKSEAVHEVVREPASEENAEAVPEENAEAIYEEKNEPKHEPHEPITVSVEEPVPESAQEPVSESLPEAGAVHTEEVTIDTTEPAAEVVTVPEEVVVTAPSVGAEHEPATEMVGEPVLEAANNEMVSETAREGKKTGEDEKIGDNEKTGEKTHEIAEGPVAEVVAETISVVAQEPAPEIVNEPVSTVTSEPVSTVINEPVSTVINEAASNVVSEVAPKAVHEPAIVIDPYHTIDYFASQGIKFVQEDNPSDKLGKQLKSFTEWLKVMKRLPQKQEEAVPDPATEHRILAFAAHSNETREIVTETMAEVLAMQGMAGKAVDVYRKLSLLNPDKSAYFAAKIEQLKVN